MTTTTNKNEQMALLLGWERFEDREFDGFDGRYSGWDRGREWMTDDVPDYTAWERFPEMQEYVRGLDYERSIAVHAQAQQGVIPESLYEPNRSILGSITPTILRDAILEVCDG